MPFSLLSQNEFGRVVKFDKTIHNFGDILISDGAQKCSFKVTNISNKPIVIHNVITSCGCTNPTWTKRPILPKKTGTIDISFLNDQGPYPFDKSITVYISDVNKPIMLRVRGVAHEKQKSLKERYPFHIGALALRKQTIDIGQIEQGLSRYESEDIANISSSPIKITFPKNDKGLLMQVSPNPIPPNSKGVLSFSVDTKESGEFWGKTIFNCNIAINGELQKGSIQIQSLIKENFTGYSEDQKRSASLPQFDKSSIDLGNRKGGETIEVTFVCKNNGKKPLTIYKIDFSEKGIKSGELPKDLDFGKEKEVEITLTTPNTKGEILYILTLITNSPTRPIVNLFITANIK
jgi:hypothetical protein